MLQFVQRRRSIKVFFWAEGTGEVAEDERVLVHHNTRIVQNAAFRDIFCPLAVEIFAS